MPIYHHLGNIPQKRHTVFKSPQGNFYYEQLFGTEGFSGHSSLSYHIHRPTQVKEILKSYSVQPKIAIDKNIKSLLLKGFDVNSLRFYKVGPMFTNHYGWRVEFMLNDRFSNNLQLDETKWNNETKF